MAGPVAAPALEALLAGAVDYAGAFPPASLPCREAFRRYQEYSRGPDRRMLGRFVVTASDLDLLLPEASARFAVLSHEDCSRADTIEGRQFVQTAKPFYWETHALEEVSSAEVLAKIRTGGVKADAIPSTGALADFILRCATLRVPFKATAGLHHPLRGEYALTYEPHAPRAVLHGFINVLLSACFACFGETDIEALLEERDPEAFRFDSDARWRDWRLSAQQVAGARREFVHSFGSCSFTEPVEDLRKLGWL